MAAILEQCEGCGTWIGWDDSPHPMCLNCQIAALRECVKAADELRDDWSCEHDYETTEPSENCCDRCWSALRYDAARAKVTLP